MHVKVAARITFSVEQNLWPWCAESGAGVLGLVQPYLLHVAAQLLVVVPDGSARQALLRYYH